MSTRFLDGPAKDVTLLLERAPLYLRAVQAPSGDWDALDHLDDTPVPDEKIVVYERRGEPMSSHVQSSVKGRRRCRWYESGEYVVVSIQPADEVLRDRARWQAWVAEHVGYSIGADGTAEERDA